MNTRDVVILVTLGAAIAVGGKTMVVKTGQGIGTGARAVYNSKVVKAPAKVVSKPFVWTAKRLGK